jgi:hypothetical protein
MTNLPLLAGVNDNKTTDGHSQREFYYAQPPRRTSYRIFLLVQLSVLVPLWVGIHFHHMEGVLVHSLICVFVPLVSESLIAKWFRQPIHTLSSITWGILIFFIIPPALPYYITLLMLLLIWLPLRGIWIYSQVTVFHPLVLIFVLLTLFDMMQPVGIPSISYWTNLFQDQSSILEILKGTLGRIPLHGIFPLFFLLAVVLTFIRYVSWIRWMFPMIALLIQWIVRSGTEDLGIHLVSLLLSPQVGLVGFLILVQINDLHGQPNRILHRILHGIIISIPIILWVVPTNIPLMWGIGILLGDACLLSYRLIHEYFLKRNAKKRGYRVACVND